MNGIANKEGGGGRNLRLDKTLSQPEIIVENHFPKLLLADLENVQTLNPNTSASILKLKS